MRAVMAFGVPCHDDAEWTCESCGLVVCGDCDPSPGESDLCVDCYETEDPEEAA